MKTGTRTLLALSAVGLLSFAGASSASTLGSDNASNGPYTDGWQTGDNGGTGFLAWTLSASTTGTGGSSGQFIGDSTTLSGTNAGANINTGTSSFGMFANVAANNTGTATSDAFRNFAGGALSIGQTFSLNIAVNFRNGAKGLNIQNSGGTNLFTFNISNDDYAVSDATTGNGSIGNAFSTNTAFRISITQTTAAGGTWTITRSGGVADSDTGTYTGSPNTVHLFINNTGTGNENNFFANGMAIVPEPNTWTTILLGVGGLAVVLRRRSMAS